MPFAAINHLAANREIGGGVLCCWGGRSVQLQAMVRKTAVFFRAHSWCTYHPCCHTTGKTHSCPGKRHSCLHLLARPSGGKKMPAMCDRIEACKKNRAQSIKGQGTHFAPGAFFNCSWYRAQLKATYGTSDTALGKGTCIRKRESCSTSFYENCHILCTVAVRTTKGALTTQTLHTFCKNRPFQWTPPTIPKNSNGINWQWISYGLPSSSDTPGNVWRPTCITFTTEKKTGCCSYCHCSPRECKNIKRLDRFFSFGGGEDSVWGCWSSLLKGPEGARIAT